MPWVSTALILPDGKESCKEFLTRIGSETGVDTPRQSWTITSRASERKGTMKPTKELIDELYREEVQRARAMSPEEKLLAGPELFEAACRIMVAGIRNQNPGIDERQVGQIFRQRL